MVQRHMFLLVKHDGPWDRPRPFMDDAAEKLKQSGKAVDSLKKGLEKEGLKVIKN